MTLGALSTLNVFENINNTSTLDTISSDYNDNFSDAVLGDEDKLSNLPDNSAPKVKKDVVKSDNSLLSLFGLSSNNSEISNPMILAGSTVPEFGSTTYEFEYQNSKIITVQTHTSMTNVNGLYIVVGNLTTLGGEVITQSVQGLGYSDSLYFGFGGATINRFNYTGQYEVSMAIYLPVSGSPDYEFIISATHILGNWSASDFVKPIADTITFNINPIDSDGSGKFDQLYVDGQIPMLNFSGEISIISIIWGSNFYNTAAFNETYQTVSAFQTLNFNLTLFANIVYELEEPENLFWAVAFGDFSGGGYEVYYSQFYLDPQDFDPPKLNFSMNHQLVDTDTNSLYDAIRGTYNITASVENVQFNLDISITADSNSLGYGYLYGTSTLESQILVNDINIQNLGFSEFIGNATISVTIHFDLPVIVNNQTQYQHLHFSKIETIFLNYTEFELSPVDMTVLEFGGLDTDGDGLYNEFLLDFDFIVDPDYYYLSIDANLYIDNDLIYGSRHIGSEYTSIYIDETWDGKLNISISTNNFLLYGSNDSIVRARVYVNARPINTSENYFGGNRNVFQNFSISQFDPPPIDIINVTDYLRDKNGNGLAEELVLNVTLNITEPMNYPELSGYLINGSGNSYLYFQGDVGIYTIELNFTYLSILSDWNYENGSFLYEIRVYDYSYGGTVREQEGVTSSYFRNQFEELPVKIVPNSVSIDFYNNDSVGEGKSGYDLVTVTLDLNITTNDQHNIRVYLDVYSPTDYIYYESQYPTSIEAGIITVTFELEGWRFYKLKSDGNITFELRGRDYVNGTSFNFNPVETSISILYLDFDPPNVIIDLSRSVTTSTRDLDSNGLADYLDITIPLKIYGDLNIQYDVSLRDELGNYLGSAYEYITISLANPQDLIVSFSSGIINERANAGNFQIYVSLHNTNVWAEIDNAEFDLGLFDPVDFDTWPAYFSDTIEINSYTIDTDSDGFHDWVVFEFGVEVRIQDFYAIEASFRMETDFGYNNYKTLYFAIDQSMSGTVTVSMRLNGIEIQTNQVNKIILSWVRIYDADWNEYDFISLGSESETLLVDHSKFENEISNIPTSIIPEDFAEYSITYPYNPDTYDSIKYVVGEKSGDTIQYEEYWGGSTYPSSSFNIEMNSRFIWNQNYFMVQLDPSVLSIGVWFNAFNNPAQIIGTQTMDVLGLSIEVWVATDGETYFYFDMVNGLLVKQELPRSYTRLLIDSNFEPGEIRVVPVPTTVTTIVTPPKPTTVTATTESPTTTTTTTSTQRVKKSDRLDLDAPNLIFLLFGLIFMRSIYGKRKQSK